MEGQEYPEEMTNLSPQRSLQLSLFLIGLVFVVAVLLRVIRLVHPVTEIPVVPAKNIPVTRSVVTPTSTQQEGKTSSSTQAAVSSTQPTVTAVRPLPPGMVCDERHFICISEAFQNAVFSNPTTVTGTAIAFENTFQWRLEDDAGTRLGSGTIMANAPDAGQPGPFSERLFQVEGYPHVLTGTLTLFEASAKDGSPLHVLTVPVKFASTKAKTVQLFLTDKTQTGLDCAAVDPVPTTIGATQTPVEATLRALLSYTGTGKKSTQIPAGTKLLSLNVTNGVALAIFSPELEADGGGSCHVTAIRSQLEHTMKQFASIKSVIIQTQGKTPEDTLQP